MKGSKYTDEQRERALALIMGGLSATKAATQLGIPKSTVCHWHNAAQEDDEDFIAARTEARRALVKRCNNIVKKSVTAIDKRITIAAEEANAALDGIKVLKKAAQHGMIALEEAEIKQLKKIIESYTGIGLRDLTGTMKDIAAQADAIESRLTETDRHEMQIAFQNDMEDMAG